MTIQQLDRPNKSRRMLWWAAFLVLLFGGYSAGWFYVANRVDQTVNRTQARLLSDQGVRLECDKQEVRGFPFRLGLFCDSVLYDDPKRDIRVLAGELRTAAQIYNPMHVVAELDGPLEILDTPDFPDLSFKTNWRMLRASARLARPVPNRISIVADDLATTMTATGDTTDKNLFIAKHVETHLRPNGADLDYAGSFAGVAIDAGLVQGRTLPAFDGTADIKIANGVALLKDRPKSLRGQGFDLRNVTLSSGEGSLSVSGPLAFDADGLMDADLQVALKNPKAIAEMFKTAVPERADQIDKAMFGIAVLGEGVSLPLKITKGRAALGFIPLGQIGAVGQ